MSSFHSLLFQARRDRGWSQENLARRAGVSRAEVSSVETGRVVPSTAVALALAAALDLRVEDLFRIASPEHALPWAWEPPTTAVRFWSAEVLGERFRYPAEATGRGVLSHDGVGWAERAPGPRDTALATLVLAGCDPAVAVLAEPLQEAGVRLLPFTRSSRSALELLRARRVHVAGLHLGDTTSANERLVRDTLGSGYRLLPFARWTEGVALAPGRRLRTVAAVLRARLRWVGREEGSGARRCLDEILEGRRPPEGYDHVASDHRGVVETIRTGWAQAGVCVQLTAEEGGLGFLPVRSESYDLCYPLELRDDPRLRTLERVVGSRAFRGLLDELPGYTAA